MLFFFCFRKSSSFFQTVIFMFYYFPRCWNTGQLFFINFFDPFLLCSIVLVPGKARLTYSTSNIKLIVLHQKILLSLHQFYVSNIPPERTQSSYACALAMFAVLARCFQNVFKCFHLSKPLLSQRKRWWWRRQENLAVRIKKNTFTISTILFVYVHPMLSAPSRLHFLILFSLPHFNSTW